MSPASRNPEWHNTTKFLAFSALVFLLTVLALPAAAAPATVTVFNDTCALFENYNATEYNDMVNGAFAPIAANMTPIADYQNLSWTKAFASLNSLMKERYAFTEWRGVDFDAIYLEWAPAIADAEKRNDTAAYYRALRGYLYSIPDGHVNALSMQGDFGAKDEDLGGGYGLALVSLDSGDVIVSYVANGSTAGKAGIREGDTVTAWGGEEIHAAINATPYIWATKKPSTREGILLQETRLLTRAPVGTNTTVTLTGSSGNRTIPLTAYDDGYDSLAASSIFVGKRINDIGAADPLNGIAPQVSPEVISTRTLPGGYTYIRIVGESYEAYQPFREIMLAAIANKTPGIIVDLRFNSGGEDELAACFAGWFVKKPAFYETATMYDPGTGEFTPLTQSWAVPQEVRYDGPVAVMVSPDTLSSGEGLPMMYAKTGRGAIISWYGTNGGFGMNGVQAILPEGIYILFPAGASLDENGTIQVDSNASRTGGVPPTVKVPLDRDTVARAMAGEDVQLTYATAWLEKQNETSAPVTAPAATRKSGPGIAIILAGAGLAMLIARRKG